MHAAAHCCENTSKLNRIYENNNDLDSESNANLIERIESLSDNYLQILQILCKSGARVNTKDNKNLTPLHYACRANSEV